MTGAFPDGAGRVVDLELPAGSAAFVDREWIAPARARPSAALVVLPDHTLRWPEGETLALDARLDASVASALVLSDLARRALHRVPESASRVEVLGSGVVAAHLRALLERRPRSRVGAPEAVVDTTGDTRQIVGATRRLADRGTLVLAAPAAGPLEIDLYPDVHRRGLELLGVALRPQDALADVPPRAHVPELYARTMTPVDAGQVLPAGLWYRVAAASRAG